MTKPEGAPREFAKPDYTTSMEYYDLYHAYIAVQEKLAACESRFNELLSLAKKMRSYITVPPQYVLEFDDFKKREGLE
jgi:hypothetical protein